MFEKKERERPEGAIGNSWVSLSCLRIGERVWEFNLAHEEVKNGNEREREKERERER